jgi:hypothetical protein
MGGNIEIDLKEMEWESVDWIDLAQEHGHELKCGGISSTDEGFLVSQEGLHSMKLVS